MRRKKYVQKAGEGGCERASTVQAELYLDWSVYLLISTAILLRAQEMTAILQETDEENRLSEDAQTQLR
jgi:hypothetical protein